MTLCPHPGSEQTFSVRDAPEYRRAKRGAEGGISVLDLPSGPGQVKTGPRTLSVNRCVMSDLTDLAKTVIPFHILRNIFV